MANVVATFTANIAPFQAAMGQMKSSVLAATNSSSTMGQRVGSSMQSIGKASTIAGVAVAAMSYKAIESYGTFQESINKAAVIAGSSNKSLKSDMKGLEDEALSLGKTLPISAEDAGNAMVEMARNGANLKDLRTEFPSIAKAAAVAGEDLSATATTVQQSMNIWGGGAKNAAMNSATLAIVANKSNAQISDMQQVFANVGSAAKTLGFSLKDVATASGIMTNAGIPAAQASMDLNHAFTQMIKPSKAARGVMDDLNLSYTDSAGNMKPLKQIIQDTATATKGMTKSQKLAALTTLFGTAGMKAMLPLMDQVDGKTKKNKGSWDDFSSALEKGAGSVAKANKYLSDNSQNMTKNVGQSIDQMKDAFDAVVKSSIGSIAPQIQDIANALGDFATWLNKSKSPLASFTKQLIAWSPIIAGVLIVFGLLSSGLGKLVSAFAAPIKAVRSLGKGTSSLPKPMAASAGQIAAMGAKSLGAGVGIGVAAAGISILVFAIADLAKTGSDGLVALLAVTGAIAALMVVLKLVAPTFQQNAVGLLAFGAAMALVSGGMAILIASFTGFEQAGGNSIGLMATIAISIGGLAAVFALVGPALNTASLGMLAFGATMLAVTGGLALLVSSFAAFQASGGNSNQLMIIMAVSVGGLAAVFAILGPLLTAGALGILAFGAAILMIGAGVALAANGLANLVNAIAVLTGKASEGTASTQNFANQSGSSLSSLGANGSSSISGLASNVSGSMAGMSANGKGSANNLSSVVSGALSQMSSSGKGSGSSLASSLTGSFGKMSGKASSTTGDIKSAFGSLASFSLSSAGAAIMNSFSSGLHSAWEGVKSFIGGIGSWISKHKGPLSYDKKLLIPAGNSIMSGFNKGLMTTYGTVQKNISGMASDISASVATVASSMRSGDLSYAAPAVSQGDMSQTINNSERTTPTFVVQNELVGDKIRTMVKEGDKENATKEQYFR